MDDHYNLYYIILEDMLRHPMSDERYEEIRKALDIFYEKIRPPWEPEAIVILEYTNDDEVRYNDYLDHYYDYDSSDN